MRIDVVVPNPARQWHTRAIERLREAGHDLRITTVKSASWPLALRTAIAVERRLFRQGELSRSASPQPSASSGHAALTIDLSGTAARSTPTLHVAFDGSTDDAAILALAADRLPDIEILLDGMRFDHAAPMVDKRFLVSAASDDIFARAITLLLRAVARYGSGQRNVATAQARTDTSGGFVPRYIGSAMPRLLREVARRRSFHFAHWRVGYRLHTGLGVAETGEIGNGWSVLPDDGSRFYADPFPFERHGRHYIFVEDYPHDTRKALISVALIDEHGIAGTPIPVLEEPHHLSYPQILERDRTIYMLPEGSGGNRLTLYRAARFPDRWEPVATLLEGEISDATLLEHDGTFWLFGTARDGAMGSTSDTMVVFHAADLLGPWTAHPANPIVIDRARARPGGAFVTVEGKLILPVQNGTQGYGGGLSLATLLHLDRDRVVFDLPRAIGSTGDFPYPRIHTLNRAGRLEVIDGIADVRRR